MKPHFKSPKVGAASGVSEFAGVHIVTNSKSGHAEPEALSYIRMPFISSIMMGSWTLFLLVMSALTSTSVLGFAGCETMRSGFCIYDATLFKSKPTMSHYGVAQLDIFYAGAIWGYAKDKSKLPSNEQYNKFLRSLNDTSDLIVLDIEHWETRGDEGAIRESLEKLSSVFDYFKSKLPGKRYGYYGIIPGRNYWCPQRRELNKCYAKWRSENDRLATLTTQVDVIFPSLYTFYQDIDGWERYAIAQIKEARRVAPDKKVIVFLWPMYHESNKFKGLEYIGDKFWQFQLDTARRYADGLVIWGGWDFDINKPANRLEDAPWWEITKMWLLSEKK